MRVVDDLEVVEVQEEQAGPLVPETEPLGDVLGQQGAVGQPVSGSWLAWWASLVSKASRSVMSSIVPTKPAPTPGVNRVGEPDDGGPDGAVLAHEPGLRLDLVAVERGRDLLDDAVQVVLVDGVDPAGAQQLLGPQPHEGAERVVDVRQAHALLGAG